MRFEERLAEIQRKFEIINGEIEEIQAEIERLREERENAEI